MTSEGDSHGRRTHACRTELDEGGTRRTVPMPLRRCTDTNGRGPGNLLPLAVPLPPGDPAAGWGAGRVLATVPLSWYLLRPGAPSECRCLFHFGPRGVTQNLKAYPQ